MAKPWLTEIGINCELGSCEKNIHDLCMKTIWFQVRHATLANYSAVIVYNVGSNKLVPMAGSDDALIPSVFLGGDDAQVFSHFAMLFKI